MRFDTTRFGPLTVEPADVIRFSAGLFGLEDCSTWVLLADVKNPEVKWLQSTSRADVAFAVVSPRRYAPGYQVRVSSNELTPLGLETLSEAKVLVIVGKCDRGMTINLKAPLIINLRSKLGRQVVTNGDHPLQQLISEEPTQVRKTA